MKKVLLTMAFILVALQADDVVHYDTKEVKKPEMNKPNHPNDNIHTQK